MALFRNRAITFGGVFDGGRLGDERQVGFDGVKRAPRPKAVFYNDLHAFDLEHKR